MKKQIDEILEEMRSKYKVKTFEEISLLDWQNHDPIKIGWRKYYPSVWSQEYGKDSILLVVQLTKWYVPNILGATDCLGFVINRSHEIMDVDAYWLMQEVGHP